MSIELKVKSKTLAAESRIIQDQCRLLRYQNAEMTDRSLSHSYRINKLKSRLNRMREHLSGKVLDIKVLGNIHKQYHKSLSALKYLKSAQYAKVRDKYLKSAQYAKVRDKDIDSETKVKINHQKNINVRSIRTLHEHKLTVVRPEARSTHLARNFLKGTPYREVENKIRFVSLSEPHYNEPNWEDIERMVTKYGKGGDYRALMQKFSNWLDEAREHLDRVKKVQG